MDPEQTKSKLFSLLNQLNDHTIKMDSLIKEINSLSTYLKISNLNLDIYIQQLNSIINAMKSKIKKYEIYANEFKTNESKEIKKEVQAQTKAQINKTIEEIKDLKIHIGFKNPFGEVHTFEAMYGTTMDKLLSTYLKTIGQDPLNSDYYFEYNGKNLYLGDFTKIEKIFSNAMEPTVLVKQYEKAGNNIVVNEAGQVYQNYNYNNYGF